MFEHILIPTDGSVRSEAAIRDGVRFAQAVGARVTCFHAVPRFHASDVMMDLLQSGHGDYEKAAMAYAERYTDFAKKVAHAAGVECDAEYATSDDPAGAIVRVAEERGCDLIWMASHGRRGIEGLLLGSETQKVLVHSKIPVLVCR